MNRDGNLIWESYSFIVELQNSEKSRKLFIKKYSTEDLPIDDKQAGHFIDDFMAIQIKLPKDSIGPKEGKPRDLFGTYYKDLDMVTSAIVRNEGDTARANKKERLIKWARNHKDIIVDNEYGIAVKINSHEESHLFGQATKWCTTTACRKNWDKYEKQSVTFIYIIDFNQEASAKAISPYDNDDGAGFYALALYDIPWEDLYAMNKEVATLPHEDDLMEYLPMAAAYPHLGGDIDEWLDKITDATDDGYGRGEMDDVDWYMEQAGEVEAEFAEDFMHRWDEQTGGMNAMEAFDDQDVSVSPIAVIEHFALPYLSFKPLAKSDTSMETRLERMLEMSNTFETSYKLWVDKYSYEHYDDRTPDPKYDPEKTMSPQRMLHKRWPSMEKKWLQWMNAVWKTAKKDGDFDRPDHTAYVNGPSWKVFQKVLLPYMDWTLEGRWGGLERYFGEMRTIGVMNFYRLKDYIVGGTHAYPQPADLELTWANKDSAFYGQTNMSDLANKITAGSAFMNVYSEMFPFIKIYYEKFDMTDRGGTVWTPDDAAYDEWSHHQMRMNEAKEMTDKMTDIFIMHFNESDADTLVHYLPQFDRVFNPFAQTAGERTFDQRTGLQAHERERTYPDTE